MTKRAFEDHEAQRERVPLLIGTGGPSGSGKTYSALRLATGMQRVTGGDIYVIDTEGRRALHYADTFKFRHVGFGPPYSPLDYMAAMEHCVAKSAGVVVVDSMSHEHEGPGGVLESHETELDRLAGDNVSKRNQMTFAAWAKPKAARRRLINTILQLGVNAVFCFRAKEKIRMPKRGEQDRDVKELGWVPIAGEEFVYEMTLHALLYPGSGGTPTWDPSLPGERAMTKLPRQFEALFAEASPLCEDHGQAMAQWAAGDEQQPTREDFEAVVAEIQAATTKPALEKVAAEQRRKAWTPDQRAGVRAALESRKEALAPAQVPPTAPTERPCDVCSSPEEPIWHGDDPCPKAEPTQPGLGT